MAGASSQDWSSRSLGVQVPDFALAPSGLPSHWLWLYVSGKCARSCSRVCDPVVPTAPFGPICKPQPNSPLRGDQPALQHCTVTLMLLLREPPESLGPPSLFPGNPKPRAPHLMVFLKFTRLPRSLLRTR